MSRTDTRSITVYGNFWEYKIGRNTVAIYDPEGNRYFPKFTDIVGEKAVASKEFQLNPAVILNYIQSIILEDRWKTEKMNACKHCNQRKPDVILRYNPYSCEIEGNNVKEFICNECTATLAENI